MARKYVNFTVSPEIEERAVRCRNGHACLHDPDYVLCGTAVDEEQGARILRCDHATDCPYSSQFGEQRVCTCPVRHEIGRKYRV